MCVCSIAHRSHTCMLTSVQCAVCTHIHSCMEEYSMFIHAQHTAHRRCTQGQCSPRPTPLPLGGHRRCARHKLLAASFSIFNPRHLPICNLKSSRPSRLSPRCSHARTIFRPKWKPPYAFAAAFAVPAPGMPCANARLQPTPPFTALLVVCAWRTIALHLSIVWPSGSVCLPP